MDFIALLFFSTTMLLVLWSLSDRHWLAIWFMTVFSTGLLIRSANSGGTSFPRLQRASGALVANGPDWIGSLVTGALWGGVIGLFPSSDIASLGFLISLYLGYFVFGAVLRAPSLKDLHAFLGAAAVTSILMLELRGDVHFEHYLPIVLLAGFGLAVLGHLHRRTLSRQIELRLEAEAQAERFEDERNQARIEMLRKNQFLAAASHDLKQPVYAIGLLAGSLEMQLQHQDTKGVLGKIQRSINSLSTLFDGILDISRLDANAMENDPQKIKLDPLFKRLHSEYELLAIAKGLSLKIDTSGGYFAHVDPTLLHRVLMNLISNAIKFTDEGSIIVSIEPKGDRLSIRITDTGCGIAANHIERVFVEYQQLRSEGCDAQAGRGLGLAIVKRLCRLMNVQISLRSTPGVGSEFGLSIVNGCPDRPQLKELHRTDAARSAHPTQPLKNLGQTSDQMAEVA